MAELDNASDTAHKKGPGVKKSKKRSTRVDLTPMVDLGFLLITFFIFTTSMTKPRVMPLIMPKDVPPIDQPPVPKSAVITLLLAKNDQVYYYEGDDPMQMKASDLHSIRDVLLDKKRRTDPTWFQVIIKPSKDATYQNTVNTLDEMTIDDVHHYAMVDITPEEYTLITALRSQH
jgi:biopolymer transport protein ExbD